MRGQIIRFCTLLLLITAGLSACSVTKYTHRKHIDDQLQLFFAANQQQAYNTMADMMYHKLFTLSSREDMISALEQLQKDMPFTLSDLVIDSIGMPIVHQDTQYVLVNYHYTMQVQFTDPNYQDPQVENQLLMNFKQQYASAEINNQHQFTLGVDARVIAIAPVKDKRWVFFEVKKGQEGLWLQFLPTAVIDRLAFTSSPLEEE